LPAKSKFIVLSYHHDIGVVTFHLLRISMESAKSAAVLSSHALP
jgi:hypothetical protein